MVRYRFFCWYVILLPFFNSWYNSIQNLIHFYIFNLSISTDIENALRYAQTMIVITLDEKQLCIYNDGPQIREDKLQSMFKPYEKGQGGQFGLGLSIVHKVVTANKYRVVA